MSDKQYQLKFRALDMTEPGSHRLRLYFLQLAARAEKSDMDAVAEMYKLIEGRCDVPEGADYTAEKALEFISANDFDALVASFTAEPTVGEASAAS